MRTEIKKIKERYPYFELGIEHDNTQTDVNQTMKINKLIDFALFCYFLVFWSNFHGRRSLERGV